MVLGWVFGFLLTIFNNVFKKSTIFYVASCRNIRAYTYFLLNFTIQRRILWNIDMQVDNRCMN
jgi:hypothetical protein